MLSGLKVSRTGLTSWRRGLLNAKSIVANNALFIFSKCLFYLEKTILLKRNRTYSIHEKILVFVQLNINLYCGQVYRSRFLKNHYCTSYSLLSAHALQIRLDAFSIEASHLSQNLTLVEHSDVLYITTIQYNTVYSVTACSHFSF